MIANVARYYRKSPPNDADANFAELTPDIQARVQKLSAILRIAEALDRGHKQRVRDVAVQQKKRSITFVARTRANASIELSAAVKRAKYFSSLFEQRIRFQSI